MSRTARRTPALLSARVLRRSRAGRAIVPTRFGGVGAWRARSNSAVLSARFRSRVAVKQRRNEAIRAGEGLT